MLEVCEQKEIKKVMLAVTDFNINTRALKVKVSWKNTEFRDDEIPWAPYFGNLEAF
jgi:hypothetical protein